MTDQQYKLISRHIKGMFSDVQACFDANEDALTEYGLRDNKDRAAKWIKELDSYLEGIELDIDTYSRVVDREIERLKKQAENEKNE